MSAPVFRVWLVIAIALWLYFGPKTFIDSRDYRETLQHVRQAEQLALQSPTEPEVSIILPKGTRDAQNQYENALDKREMLRERLITDLIGIAVPIAFLALFWLAGRTASRKNQDDYR